MLKNFIKKFVCIYSCPIFKKTDLFFEVKDIFGKYIRTTKSYWDKIFLLNIKNLRFLRPR